MIWFIHHWLANMRKEMHCHTCHRVVPQGWRGETEWHRPGCLDVGTLT